MNKKEISEIRRRMKLDHNAIRTIYGCYVNTERKIISEVEENLGLLTQEETTKYLDLFKKALGGHMGKELLNISFPTADVMTTTRSTEYQRLTDLRESELDDPDVRAAFYRRIIDTMEPGESNYVILLTYDAYDVPQYGSDGKKSEDTDEVFKYILCCVCPVKSGKLELGYEPKDGRFHSAMANQIVGKPILGFMFPAFDERTTNIYNALFYSHNAGPNHHSFANAVFNTGKAPMTGEQQKIAFDDILTSSLEADCSFQVIQNLHEQIGERLLLHKESGDPAPLMLSPAEMGEIIRTGGLKEEERCIEVFQKSCEERFGDRGEIQASNIGDAKKMTIGTPEVKISVDPRNSHLIQTRVIDGKKYILISAETEVQINGINVSIDE